MTRAHRLIVSKFHITLPHTAPRSGVRKVRATAVSSLHGSPAPTGRYRSSFAYCHDCEEIGSPAPQKDARFEGRTGRPDDDEGPYRHHRRLTASRFMQQPGGAFRASDFDHASGHCDLVTEDFDDLVAYCESVIEDPIADCPVVVGDVHGCHVEGAYEVIDELKRLFALNAEFKSEAHSSSEARDWPPTDAIRTRPGNLTGRLRRPIGAHLVNDGGDESPTRG